MADKILLAQFLALAFTSALFVAAFLFGLHHRRGVSSQKNAPSPSMGPPALTTVLLATLCDAALLAWRALAEGKITLPLSNHFDAFLVLALLLALVLMYLCWTRHLRALAFFMLPMIAAMLLLGGILELFSPKPYHYESIWTILHLATITTGSACFALSCVGGIVYLLADRNLKRKRFESADRTIRFPPLASIEKFNRWTVYLGFPLLTMAMITGALRLAQGAWTHEAHRQALPKIILALLAWIVYAVLLPVAPRFRGKRAAILSIAGFFFVLAGYFATLLIK